MNKIKELGGYEIWHELNKYYVVQEDEVISQHYDIEEADNHLTQLVLKNENQNDL